MAKVIRLSDDNGVSWENLPGSEGSFTNEAEAIDDTILGQTYASNEVGLVSWQVSSNGIFKGFAGYLAEIKSADGTPTAMTDEAMSQVSGQIYQVDDATREIWDRSSAVTFEDNSVAVAAADIESVDYLFGRVTFVSGYTVTGPVTVSGNFIPTSTLARANAYVLNMTAEGIDESTFETSQGNNGTRIFVPGLRTVTVELTGIFDDVTNAKVDLRDRNEVIVEIDPAGDGSAIARGYYKLSTTGQSGAVGALEEETLNYLLQVPIADSTNVYDIEYPFSWQFESSSTLSQAIRIAIDAWLNEINTTEVQYLPQGPLDGIQGDVMFADISLSGGLSNMNVFTMEMQGTGQWTEV